MNKSTKFKSHLEESSGLVNIIESLPTATDNGAKKSIAQLQEYFVETLSKRDANGNIITPFPVEKDPKKLIEFTKNYVGNEYGEALYKDYLKDYIDAFWEEIKKSNVGEGLAYELVVKPLEKLAEDFKVDPKMKGKTGKEYENLRAMLEKIDTDKLEDDAAKKLVDEFVDGLKNVKDRTKEYLKEYLINKKDEDVKEFYSREVTYKIKDLMIKNSGDFRSYTTDIGAEVWDKGTGAPYEKYTGILDTTGRMEASYRQISDRMAKARG